ncbi:MAG: carbohydrate binding family 9 domain-containing protein [Ignavibacteriae bacterium]|nr:carbohydrate binding family 9 domain-containing protein [Ignavibacteria bacterium]MBI3364564.1 carbohydrate binding family 9 domain-containing protein [Ignavibacteriota bacterium]
MKHNVLLPFVIFLSIGISFNRYGYSRTESADGVADTAKARPIIEAVRVTNPIKVDGVLSEGEWQRPGAANFTQRDPIEGSQPSQKTEVWIAYDDEAIYVAARMYDTHPDSIVTRIGRRDADLSSDWFYVGIDSYHDRRTGFYFGVYAGGAISDGILFNDSWDDNTWDGVWDAASKIDDKGWTVEMKIPYSQLRFPKQDEYVWGVNFIRSIERNKERDDFVMVPKKESGWVSRFADLVGLKNINPPTKLEVLPYVVAKQHFTNQFTDGNPFNDGSILSSNTGVDIKYGLGSNLTLNATINPDFGQVEVDPAVVNLTQFETFFQEKRPFFIEGSNFFDFGYGGANNNWGFNFGNPEYFYSRRIGRPPRGDVQHDGFVDYPDATRILGAAKITGKIAEGWSLGSMHAVTVREHATVEDTAGHRYSDIVEPLASYNVIRSLREFNEGKQAIGFIGTATLRDFDQPYLVDNFNHQSFALGMDGWTNLDSKGEFVVTSWFSTSRVQGTSDRILALQENPLHYFQRPDATEVHLDSSATSLSGYAGRVALNKQKGNTYLNAAVGTISPGFDSNDLGYLFRTNVINAHLVLGYSWYDPDGIFRRKGFNLATFRNFDYAGEKTGEGYFLFYNAQFMNYWNVNGNFNFSPAILDPRNTRGGPIMKTTNLYNSGIYGSTDSRNSLIYNLGISAARSESGGYRVTLDPGIGWKPASGVSLSLFPEINHDVTIAQWVMNQDDPAATRTYGARYVFGKLDLQEVSASIRLDWTFTPKLTLQLFLQPLISVGRYNEFKELKQPGMYSFNRYGKDNGSTIDRADHDFQVVFDPNYPTDTTQVYQGDYVVDPDGNTEGSAVPFKISNPDFNFKSLRVNAVVRWEYLPGSTAYFVWTRGSTSGDHPGDFSFSRDFRDMLTAPDHDDVFLIKLAYWWHP